MGKGNVVRLNLKLDKEVHREFKVAATEDDTTMQEQVVKLIRTWLAKRSKKK